MFLFSHDESLEKIPLHWKIADRIWMYIFMKKSPSQKRRQTESQQKGILKKRKRSMIVWKLVPLLRLTPSATRKKRSVEEVLFLIQNADRRWGGRENIHLHFLQRMSSLEDGQAFGGRPVGFCSIQFQIQRKLTSPAHTYNHIKLEKMCTIK